MFTSKALAMTEATLKSSKEQLSQEQKNLADLQRSLTEVRIPYKMNNLAAI